MDKFLGGVLVALVIAGGVFVFTRTEPVAVTPPSGAAGNDFGGRIVARDGITVGGIVMSTSSTAGTYTPTALELSRTPQVILWTPNVNTTLSISGTSTRAYVPNVGDTAEIYIRNASTTAAASITFAAADAGVDMQFAEATGGDLVLVGLDWAKVTLIRTSTHLTTVIFDEMTEAD